MRETYVLFNPTNQYAVEVIEWARRTHGLLPVLVWLTGKERLFWRQHLPILRSDAVVAEFCLDALSAAEVAAALSKKYVVKGVVPYAEQTLSPAADLLEHLPLRWNEPAMLRRFRDKNTLKSYLREHHPHVPMNQTRLVTSTAEVFSQPLPARFVIKPNDGFANRDVGFFNAQTPRGELDAYFGAAQRQRYILEDFLEGPEYAVNGQMDHLGKAMVLNITRYERTAGNGKPNLYRFLFHVPRTDAAFAPLADYAKAVMDATGLLRCPFHMEVMLTPDGPRMIEVGARFGGLDYVYITNEVHDNALNAFALATHYWLFDAPYPDAVANWPAYDANSLLQLDGIAAKKQRIYSVEGMDQIEALPEFRAWVFKPHLGQVINRTVDLYTIPYSFRLKSRDSEESLRAAALHAESNLHINRKVNPLRRVFMDATETLRKVLLRGRLIVNRLRQV